MCLCDEIIQKEKLSIIDTDLTPVNASLKGYTYLEDIPNLYRTLIDLLEIAEIQGFKIGRAKQKKAKKHFGLYLQNRNK